MVRARGLDARWLSLLTEAVARVHVVLKQSLSEDQGEEGRVAG